VSLLREDREEIRTIVEGMVRVQEPSLLFRGNMVAARIMAGLSVRLSALSDEELAKRAVALTDALLKELRT
jgi:hypothetical protein